ncbi:hypothetical protein DAKH74_030680 [Maudiozyma humilis]|uniref:Uncharacterized protein n=1 Tax=Maudiozyma humilis TaxID=51915 RepID=A0AAV5S0J3_MAUHU|nr:hypothetical protein DAKH74_030680 [Kazachstania humilis]
MADNARRDLKVANLIDPVDSVPAYQQRNGSVGSPLSTSAMSQAPGSQAPGSPTHTSGVTPHPIQDYKRGTGTRPNLVPILPSHHKSLSIGGEATTIADTVSASAGETESGIARPQSAQSTTSNPAPYKKRTLNDLLSDRPRSSSTSSTCSSCSSASTCSSCSTCSSASNSAVSSNVSSRVASLSQAQPEPSVPRLSAKNKPSLKRRRVPPPLNLSHSNKGGTGKTRRSPLHKTSISANAPDTTLPHTAVQAQFAPSRPASAQSSLPQSAPAHVTSFRGAAKQRKPRVVYLGRQHAAPAQQQEPVALPQQGAGASPFAAPFSPYGVPPFYPPFPPYLPMGMGVGGPLLWPGPYARRRSSAAGPAWPGLEGATPTTAAMRRYAPAAPAFPAGPGVPTGPSVPGGYASDSAGSARAPQQPRSNIIPSTQSPAPAKNTAPQPPAQPPVPGAAQTNADAGSAGETTAVEPAGPATDPEPVMAGELRLMRNVFSFEFPALVIPHAGDTASEEAMKKVFLNICGRIWDESRVLG